MGLLPSQTPSDHQLPHDQYYAVQDNPDTKEGQGMRQNQSAQEFSYGRFVVTRTMAEKTCDDYNSARGEDQASRDEVNAEPDQR